MSTGENGAPANHLLEQAHIADERRRREPDEIPGANNELPTNDEVHRQGLYCGIYLRDAGIQERIYYGTLVVEDACVLRDAGV